MHVVKGAWQVDPMHENDRHAQDGESQFRAPAVRAVAQTADELRKVDYRLVEWVRERPLASVGIALGVGYLVGRLFSRWG
jgi:ElaB/YqjD/DUF883 family membrane-anchored ribosome-binding protein